MTTHDLPRTTIVAQSRFNYAAAHVIRLAQESHTSSPIAFVELLSAHLQNMGVDIVLKKPEIQTPSNAPEQKAVPPLEAASPAPAPVLEVGWGPYTIPMAPDLYEELNSIVETLGITSPPLTPLHSTQPRRGRHEWLRIAEVASARALRMSGKYGPKWIPEGYATDAYMIQKEIINLHEIARRVYDFFAPCDGKL